MGNEVYEWHEIPGFKRYHVNQLGEIIYCGLYCKSKSIIVFRPVKQKLNKKTGYMQVKMIDNTGKQRTMRVHRVVLETFCGKPQHGQEARHGVNGKLDNSLKNLCWGTKKENCKDKIRDGTSSRGERNAMSVLNTRQVSVIRKLKNIISQYNLANYFNVSRSCIALIHQGKRWATN